MNFVPFFFFWFCQNSHGTKFLYMALASVCHVLCQVFLVGSWMELVFLVLWSQHQVGKGLYWCGMALFVVTHSDLLQTCGLLVQ